MQLIIIMKKENIHMMLGSLSFKIEMCRILYPIQHHKKVTEYKINLAGVNL
jgi:hypothetical protein